MAKIFKKIRGVEEAIKKVVATGPSEKEKLEAEKEVLVELYDALKTNAFNSIGDVENKIARINATIAKL